MKAKYEAPKMIQVTLQTRHLFSSSTTQDVYTDSPMTPDQALVKGQNSNGIWGDEW